MSEICGICKHEHNHEFVPIYKPEKCKCTIKEWVDEWAFKERDGVAYIPYPCDKFDPSWNPHGEKPDYCRCGHYEECHNRV